jgi:hypothetical protein
VNRGSRDDTGSDAQSGGEPIYDRVWYWRTRLPERKGEPCRVVVRGRRGSVLVEFPDGLRVVTSHRAVRRAAPPAGDR